MDSHQAGLLDIDTKCVSLDLEIHPDKCFSLVLKRGKPISKAFSIHQGSTTSITKSTTKYLGEFIGATATSEKKVSAKMLRGKLEGCLLRLEESKVRGDYKIWLQELHSSIIVFSSGSQ